MAKFKAKEVDSGRKIEQIYVARVKKYSFKVKVLDANGDLIPLLNPNTRVQQLQGDGTPLWIEKVVEFENRVSQVQRGCLSEYVVYSDTPQPIKDKLAELCEDRSSAVITREQHIQDTNPAQYEEIQRRKTLEKDLESKYAPLVSEVSELRAKIAELEKAGSK